MSEALVKAESNGDPNGIRTRVTAVKGRCPRPLDDRVTKPPNIPFVSGKATSPRFSATEVPAGRSAGRCGRLRRDVPLTLPRHCGSVANAHPDLKANTSESAPADLCPSPELLHFSPPAILPS